MASFLLLASDRDGDGTPTTIFGKLKRGDTVTLTHQVVSKIIAVHPTPIHASFYDDAIFNVSNHSPHSTPPSSLCTDAPNHCDPTQRNPGTYHPYSHSSQDTPSFLRNLRLGYTKNSSNHISSMVRKKRRTKQQLPDVDFEQLHRLLPSLPTLDSLVGDRCMWGNEIDCCCCCWNGRPSSCK